VHQYEKIEKYKKLANIDFKLSPCPESCTLSFGSFLGVWILYADVSEHCVLSSWAGRCV